MFSEADEKYEHLHTTHCYVEKTGSLSPGRPNEFWVCGSGCPARLAAKRDAEKTVFICTVRERKLVDNDKFPKREDTRKKKWVLSERFEGNDKKAMLEKAFKLLDNPEFQLTIMRKR